MITSRLRSIQRLTSATSAAGKLPGTISCGCPMIVKDAEEDTSMDAYIYGERRTLPDGFEAYGDRSRSAVVSIDMHQGHLADTPDCPCPAPRARELVAPIDETSMGSRERAGEFVTRVEPGDMTVNTKTRLSAFYPVQISTIGSRFPAAQPRHP